MTTRPFFSHYKSIARLGLPILVGQLGMIIVGFADNAMVGHYSTEALASASFVNNLFNTAIFCCIGFTYGITPMVGALFGQADQDMPRRIGALMRNALVLNTLFTLTVTVVMTVLYFFLDKMGQPAELLPLIRPYYLLYLAGMLPIGIFNAFAQWAYGINNTRSPMWIILAANAINVLGNWLLIYGVGPCPELGLVGAGISTLIARLFCPIVLIAFFLYGKQYTQYSLGFRKARISGSSLSALWRTSLPVSMQLSFESGSFTVAAIMAGWLGKFPLAAFQILVIVGTLGFCVYYSIGSAITILVANEAGRGNKPMMRRVAWAGYHVMLLFMIAASLTFIFGGEALIGVFSTDTDVIHLAMAMIFPLVLYQLGDATQITFAGALRGTAHVMPMLWIAFFSYIVVGIPATYLLAFPAQLGLYGIFLSFSVSLFIAGALFLYQFLRHSRA